MIGMGRFDVDWEDVPTPGRVEDDEALRARLLYVAGDGAAEVQRIRVASGLALEEIADRFGLKRRRL